MKNYRLYIMSFLFTVFVFTSAASANAQSANPMTLDVPFEFYAGDKLLSPGKYTIVQIRNEAFLLQNTAGNEKIIVPTPQSARFRQNAETEQIVFNRYGDRYFLRQIFANRMADGFSLLKSKTEKIIQKELSRTNLKKSVFNPEQVAIQKAK